MAGLLDGMPDVGEVVADKYRLTEVIGTGASGTVYEAEHEVIGRIVALKWLYPHLASDDVLSERFLREARAACSIDHPNVVEVYDAGRDRESLYLVMERLRGEPLSAVFERGIQSHTNLVATLMPALRGIAAAHAAGIVHRDLKPDNIFIPAPRPGRIGGAKVLDFGISKLRDPKSRQLTTVGMMMGSPYYMAPEQIADSSAVDPRADVFSIGVMLYEGLTGDVPFEAESLAKLYFRITNEDAAPIHRKRKDVPAPLEAAVLKAMSAKADDRFAGVDALARALEPYAQGVPFLRSMSAEEIAAQPTNVKPAPAQGPDDMEGAATQVDVRIVVEEDEETDPEKKRDVPPRIDELPEVPTLPLAEKPEELADPTTVPPGPPDEDEERETDPKKDEPKGRVDIGELRTLELDRGETLPDELVEEARKLYAEKRAHKRRKAELAFMESTDVYAKSTARPRKRVPWVAVLSATVLIAFVGALVFAMLSR